MPEAYTRVGGVWKRIAKVHVRAGGAWKEVQKGYVRIGGVWKLFFQNVVVAFTGITNVASGPVASFLFLVIEADGSVDRETDGGTGNAVLGSWITPEAASQDESYEVRFSVQSGDPPTFGSLDVWQSLSVDVAVGYSGGVAASCTLLAETRLGAVTLGSQTYDFSYTRS